MSPPEIPVMCRGEEGPMAWRRKTEKPEDFEGREPGPCVVSEPVEADQVALGEAPGEAEWEAEAERVRFRRGGGPMCPSEPVGNNSRGGARTREHSGATGS